MRIYMHLCQVSFIIIRHVLTISVVYKGKSTQKNNKLCDIQSPLVTFNLRFTLYRP